ncbi:isochorismatase domain-containing protein 1-like [Tubulanus polymorphus]|uniref:isochorismatase domain-containing protein 1-like n=1 Tax=Tubulanus polymorphus TaxID=672921 RepID=UPI003DA5D950
MTSSVDKMAAPMSVEYLGNLEPSRTAVFMCDIQERFRPSIKYFNEIVEISKRLTEMTKILEIPLIVTEQYPKGLLHTVAELDISHATGGVVEKTKFSMIVPEVEEIMKTICDGNLKYVVLFGVETHVCIQQTAIDLMSKGIKVHIVADATSSRFQSDRLIAFDRLRQFGAIITTSESVLFQLLGDKDHPHFKQIQALVKGDTPDTGLLHRS